MDPRDLEAEYAARREAERDWKSPLRPLRRDMTLAERVIDLERRLDKLSAYLLSK